MRRSVKAELLSKIRSISEYKVKAVVSLILVLFYAFVPGIGFPGGGMLGHVLYPLCHVNIWHLLVNVLCFWMVPCRIHLISSYVVAVLCSFLPCFTVEVTLGFSGVLFASVGMSWGRVNRFWQMVWRNKWFLVIPFFLPHVNAFIHVYCMLCGWFIGWYFQEMDLRR